VDKFIEEGADDYLLKPISKVSDRESSRMMVVVLTLDAKVLFQLRVERILEEREWSLRTKVGMVNAWLLLTLTSGCAGSWQTIAPPCMWQTDKDPS
jgi:PleD family two-component response regulator